MFGYTSLVITHLLASMPVHLKKTFAFYRLYSRFLPLFKKKRKKQKTLDSEAN